MNISLELRLIYNSHGSSYQSQDLMHQNKDLRINQTIHHHLIDYLSDLNMNQMKSLEHIPNKVEKSED